LEMLNDLKRQVCRANKEMAAQGVVHFTWGNVSGFDSSMGLFVIKPSGVPYEVLQPELMVVMSLEGQKVEGRLEPSLDSDVHRAIYMSWPFAVSAIAHTRSTYAMSFAQAGLPIPAMGITHADHFGGSVPVTRAMEVSEIEGNYEENIGRLIVEAVDSPDTVPAVLVNRHGPYTWGKDPMDAVRNAVYLEHVAKACHLTWMLNPQYIGIDDTLLHRRRERQAGKKPLL
jgi:L-ribulose-5-phosphate 4-epimerase